MFTIDCPFVSALELGEQEQDSLLDELYRRVEVREIKELSGLARSAGGLGKELKEVS